jgi:hypothetical protein
LIEEMRYVVVLFCFVLVQPCFGGVAESTGVVDTPVGLQQEAPASKTLPTTVAWILFGGMAMLMTIFYLLRYKDKDINDATWLVISNAVSLFCAVLLFLAFRELVALATDGDDIQDRRLAAASDDAYLQCWDSGSGHRRLSQLFSSRRLAGVPTQKTLTVDALCFIFVFVAWESSLFFARKRKGALSALGMVAGHCVGFSALYAFGNMQQCEPFRKSPGVSLVVVILALVAMVLLGCISDVVRRWYVKKGSNASSHVSHDDHCVHNWCHQCAHTEREAMAFAVSFLIAQVLEYISTDTLAPLHHVPKGRDPGNALMEFCFTAGLAVTVIAAGYAEHMIAHSHGHDKLVASDGSGHHGHEMSREQLAMHMVKDTLAFTTGWCLLTLLKLVFWSATNDNGVLGGGDVMTSHIVVVFISSAVTFSAFFVIDFIADRMHGHLARGLRALGKAFMIFLGLAWEGAFWEGSHSMAQGMGFESQTSRMLAVIVLSLAFCALVMPAWIMYIVPYTFEVEGDEVHIKDYDDHMSPKSEGKVEHSLSMVTMTGDVVPQGSSEGSTCDLEAPASTPSGSGQDEESALPGPPALDCLQKAPVSSDAEDDECASGGHLHLTVEILDPQPTKFRMSI